MRARRFTCVQLNETHKIRKDFIKSGLLQLAIQLAAYNNTPPQSIDLVTRFESPHRLPDATGLCRTGEDTTNGILLLHFHRDSPGVHCSVLKCVVVQFNMSGGKEDGSTASNKAVPKKKKRKSSSAKAGLQFPVGRIGRYLQSGKYANKKLKEGAPVYLAAVLEFLCAEILELAGNAARNERNKNAAGNNNSIEAASQQESYRIEPNHITSAVKNDEELHSSILNIQNTTTHKQLNKREYTAAKTIQQLQAAEQKKEAQRIKLEKKQQAQLAKQEKQRQIELRKLLAIKLRHEKTNEKRRLMEEKHKRELEEQRLLEEDVRARIEKFKREKREREERKKLNKK